MLHFINDDHLFENNSETHYRYHTRLDLAQYPQVHNFYEIVAVTSGVLHMQLCGQKLSLHEGQLVFIRPGDIHSKSGENTEHINLAFPAHTVEALFQYLKNDEAKEKLLSSPVPPGPFSFPLCILFSAFWHTLPKWLMAVFPVKTGCFWQPPLLLPEKTAERQNS